MGLQEIGQPAVDHGLSSPFLQDNQVYRHVVGFQKAEQVASNATCSASSTG